MLVLQKTIKNERGMAVIEMIPIIMIIMVLLVSSFGFFGAIHTAIVGSIATRNYAFETIRHRADMVYFRSVSTDQSTKDLYFSKNGFRAHQRIDRNTQRLISSVARRIDFMLPSGDELGTSVSLHNDEIPKIKYGKRYMDSDGVNPIWVRTQYGICVNSACGD